MPRRRPDGQISGTSPAARRSPVRRRRLVGHDTITLVLMPERRSSSVLAVFSVALIPSMLGCGGLGAFLWQHGGMAYVAGTASMGLFAALPAIWPIQLQRDVAHAPL